MIDRATIDRITDAARIEEVVGDFVTLKRAGANLKGLCPFHPDRTPSFFVSPARNYCKCFACGEGGNPVSFIMKHEQLSFTDAIRYLGHKYGIDVEEKDLSPGELQRRDDRESMLILNEWAKKWFQSQLYDTTDGRNIGLTYLRGRGFRDDILERFQVGFCPNNRQTSLAADALKAGFREEYIINTPNDSDTRQSIGTGLAFKNDNGKLRDRFAGRVIWPIFTISGKVAGFGGRVLDAATKGVNIKYQNSPESLIYSKRRELYGLFQAKKAISKEDLCYLVEGYTDVMAMHQSGVENVVASSGTALTDEQIRLIHRLTDNIVVIYDGDAAGIKASQRGIDMLLKQGMNVKLLLLPQDEDPDSFARKLPSSDFKAYLSSHQTDFIKFKINLLMEEAKNDPVALSQLVNNIVQSISVIPNEITRSFYIRETAQTMHMQEDIIARAVAKQAHTSTNTPNPTNQTTTPPIETTPTTNDSFYKIEREIIRALIRYGNITIGEHENTDGSTTGITVVTYIDLALKQDNLELRTPLFRNILAEALQHSTDEAFNFERFFTNHQDPSISTTAFDLVTNKEHLSKIHLTNNQNDPFDAYDHAAKLVSHLLTDYKISIIKEQQKDIDEQLKDPTILQDNDRFNKLMERFMSLKETEKKLSKTAGDRVIITL